jgi:hypothetical protein
MVARGMSRVAEVDNNVDCGFRLMKRVFMNTENELAFDDRNLPVKSTCTMKSVIKMKGLDKCIFRNFK